MTNHHIMKETLKKSLPSNGMLGGSKGAALLIINKYGQVTRVTREEFRRYVDQMNNNK